MRKRSPARYVVRPADVRHGRARMLWLAFGWLLSLVAAVLATYLLAYHAMARSQNAAAASNAEASSADDAAMRQTLAQLRQSRAVDQVSIRKLQQSLATRDQTITGLRADLAFYARLVNNTKRGQVQVEGVHVAPVPHASRAWNITVTLTRNAREKSKASGVARVSVQGIRGQKVTRLTWAVLAGDQPADGLPFDFRFFQQLKATLMLPAGFTPNKLRVTLTPHHGGTITSHVTWADALKKTGNTDVQ